MGRRNRGPRSPGRMGRPHLLKPADQARQHGPHPGRGQLLDDQGLVGRDQPQFHSQLGGCRALAAFALGYPEPLSLVAELGWWLLNIKIYAKFYIFMFCHFCLGNYSQLLEIISAISSKDN